MAQRGRRTGRRAEGTQGELVLDDQVRWVLRNARLHAADPTLRTAAGFAAGGGRAPAVHRAQVGRWENGGAEVTHELVRRYEHVLGLPEGQLLRSIDYLSREVEPQRVTPTLVPRGAPDFDGTLALLERAVGTERLRGLDWDVLSGNLSRMPHALIRAQDWEALMRRCLLEMTVAVGLEFAQRDEAVARLAGHPRSGAIVVSMARAILEDPSSAVYSDAATLLRYSSHRDVVPFLLRHVAAPTNSDSLRSCLFVLTMVADAGRLGAAEAAAAARQALAVVRDAALPFYVHRAAANLLRALDLPNRRRLASVLTADDRRHVAAILMEGRALGLEAITALKRRVIASLVESLGPVDRRDVVLQDLLDTVLGNTEEAARSSALAVLMLSPQSKAVGLAYAAELGRARECRDDVAVVECLSVLTWLVQPESLDDLTAMALATASSGEQAMLGAIGVGNCPEPRSVARAARELAIERRALEIMTGSGPDLSAAGSTGGSADLEGVRQQFRGLVYALGLRGRFDLIEGLAAQLRPGRPQTELCRQVLGWWLELPAHLRPESNLP
jgi:hypothetical protein